jgi:hypothetical protein
VGGGADEQRAEVIRHGGRLSPRPCIPPDLHRRDGDEDYGEPAERRLHPSVEPATMQS